MFLHRSRRAALQILVCLAIGATGCSKNSSSPTDPGNVPSLAGQWTGSWAAGFVTTAVRMELHQAGSSITGSYVLTGNSLAVTGSVSGGSFRWSTPGILCGVITGEMSFSGDIPTTMSGSSTFDPTGCPNAGSPLSGPMNLTRSPPA